MAGELGYDTGPFVRIAAFCEQAIEEKDGVLTLVRLVDRLTVSVAGPGAPEELPEGAAINATLVIGLTPGEARGPQRVQVVFEHPDGSRHEGPKMPVHFTEGPTNGANLVLKMAIVLSSAGLYWARVIVNDRLVTKAPLEIRYEGQPT